MKQKDLPKKNAVLMGGPGSERDVSLATGRGVSNTGDGVEESLIAFDKILTKEKFHEHNVVTPEWEVLDPGQRPKIAVPLVVKPARQGSTVGVVIVKNESEVDSAMKEA